MTHDVAELRRQVRALGSRHRGARVPRGLRAAIAAYARDERSAGASCRAIAERLGVSTESIRRWAQRPARRDRRGDGLVPVNVVAEAARPVTVWAPSGDRVEGLSLAEAAELLRHLR
jgi:hypothetical protein